MLRVFATGVCALAHTSRNSSFGCQAATGQLVNTTIADQPRRARPSLSLRNGLQNDAGVDPRSPCQAARSLRALRRVAFVPGQICAEDVTLSSHLVELPSQSVPLPVRGARDAGAPAGRVPPAIVSPTPHRGVSRSRAPSGARPSTHARCAHFKEYDHRHQIHRRATRRQEARTPPGVCEADDDQPDCQAAECASLRNIEPRARSAEMPRLAHGLTGPTLLQSRSRFGTGTPPGSIPAERGNRSVDGRFGANDDATVLSLDKNQAAAGAEETRRRWSASAANCKLGYRAWSNLRRKSASVRASTEYTSSGFRQP